MSYNKSLSARIRRRNKCGFLGIGSYTGRGVSNNYYGDYSDPFQSHKASSFEIAKRRKNKNNSAIGRGISLTKKYSNNKQKTTNIVKRVLINLKSSFHECL